MTYHLKTFDTFFEDESNRFAVAACKAAAKQPGDTCNPLWIYGPSGCGKSHLFEAVCKQAQQEHHATVCAMNAREAMEGFIGAFGKGASALKRLEECDVLVLHNADVLFAMCASQQELARRILDKCARGQQVLLSSTMPPKKLQGLHEALFQKAPHVLFVEIGEPSVVLRRRLAQQYLDAQPFPITANAVEFLVHHAQTVPKLQGAFNAAQHAYRTTDRKVTLWWAKSYIKTITR